MARSTGISNRETAEQEAAERREHPRRRPEAPSPDDEALREGEGSALEEVEAEVLGEGQTSHKAGSRSLAQKEEGSRHLDSPAPSTHKTEGAFGREPKDRRAESAGREDDDEGRGRE